jgi:CelD/BcsL family acetyltransferase involved in cellulose biosynthesis
VLTTELRSLDTLTPADVAAWRALAATAAEPNPYFEPEAVLPAARHLGGTGLGLLVARDGDRWTGCLPVQRRVRPVQAAARLGRLPGPCVVAWLHTHCFLGTPLLARDDPAGAAVSLVGALARGRGTGWLGFPTVGRDGPVAPALSAAFAEHGLAELTYERAQRAMLHRRGDGDYLAGMAPKRRREAARQRKALARELGAELRTTDRAGDPAAVERFLALEDGGWKGREGTSFLRIGGQADFVRELCDGFRAQGRLQLLELSAGGRAVAMKCNLVSGDGIFCFKIAYAEDVGRHSPGIQLELDNVQAFHATTTAAFTDSCAASDNQMINRLWPDRRTVATALVPTRGALGAVARRALPATISIRERIGGP